MTRRRYSSTASATTLSSSITNSQTSLVVGSVSGFPGLYPYELILELGTASEEAVLVTAGGGTTLTVTRGFDGTTGLAHGAGATVIHGFSAIDLDEANSHVNEVTTAHGITLANLVQLVAAQVLTNKTINLASNTLTGTKAQFNTAVSDADLATLTGTEVLTNKDLSSTTNTILPAGMLSPFAGSAAPAGWLLCDGSSQLRATYAALFTAIGTTYGSVDGTHFTLPDLRGRVPAGRDAGQTEFDVLGETGGEKMHLLTATESGLPDHTHALSWGSTPAVGNAFDGFARTNVSVGAVGSGLFGNGVIGGAQAAASAHNNLQPYVVLNYVIKV